MCTIPVLTYGVETFTIQKLIDTGRKSHGMGYAWSEAVAKNYPQQDLQSERQKGAQYNQENTGCKYIMLRLRVRHYIKSMDEVQI